MQLRMTGQLRAGTKTNVRFAAGMPGQCIYAAGRDDVNWGKMKADQRQTEGMVRQWFGTHSQSEWKRLRRNPYPGIEFTVTMHFLEKHLPKEGLVLDAGGGPGRYTVELAKRGYDVVLLDLVPEMLDLAKRKIRKASVSRRVRQTVQGSVDDLSMFNEETFDAVLCLGGPLCHLLKKEQREKAAAELVRVAKKDAPIFVSVISRIGLLKTLLIRFQNDIPHAKPQWETGDYVPGIHGEGFTAAHWFLPEELAQLFNEKGAEVLDMAGLEGLSSHREKETNKLFKDRKRWNIWMDILLKTCTHASVIGSSEHFLLVGRKQTASCKRKKDDARSRKEQTGDSQTVRLCSSKGKSNNNKCTRRTQGTIAYHT